MKHALHKPALAISTLLLSLLLMAQTAQAQTIKIGALVSGQVIKVHVKNGQRIKAGQLLMQIDDTRYQAKLKSLNAALKQQQLIFADRRIELDQALDLFDRTVSTKRELEAAQLAYDISEQKIQQAQADVDSHKAWQRHYNITAPFSGRVKTIFAPVGTTVFEENDPLIHLVR